MHNKEATFFQTHLWSAKVSLRLALGIIWSYLEKLFLLPPPRKSVAFTPELAWAALVTGSWASWADCDSSRGGDLVGKSRTDGTSGCKKWHQEEKKPTLREDVGIWHLFCCYSTRKVCVPLQQPGTTCHLPKPGSWNLFPAWVIENPKVS